MVEYFSTTRWDGAVDLSWYNGTDTEFTLTTPAQLAGVAELVNSNTADFAGKTIRLGADISLLRYVEPGKPGEPSQPTQPEKPTTPDTPRHRRQQQRDRPVGCVGCGWRGHHRAGGAACHQAQE